MPPGFTSRSGRGPKAPPRVGCTLIGSWGARLHISTVRGNLAAILAPDIIPAPTVTGRDYLCSLMRSIVENSKCVGLFACVVFRCLRPMGKGTTIEQTLLARKRRLRRTAVSGVRPVACYAARLRLMKPIPASPRPNRASVPGSETGVPFPPPPPAIPRPKVTSLT